MRLTQIVDENDKRALVVTARGDSRLVKGLRTMGDLAAEALAEGAPLRKIIADRGIGKPVDLAAALKEKRVLIPIDHDDPAHIHVTGTGLTHLGSAEGRDKMHRTLADATTLTDSMKMFKLGLDGGKPAPGATGVQPEWFYKGDGSTLAPPGGDLVSPSFALDGGEEPEIVGLYVVDHDGQPVRVGFALGNEFSDHVIERQNYLYLAHSKLQAGELRPRAAGRRSPRRRARRLAHPPRQGRSSGRSRSSPANRTCRTRSPISRRTISNTRSSAARATSTSISSARRRCRSPTASSAEKGDVFEIESEPFGLPLRNRLTIGKPDKVKLRVL